MEYIDGSTVEMLANSGKRQALVWSNGLQLQYFRNDNKSLKGKK